MDNEAAKKTLSKRQDSRQIVIEKGGKHHVSWVDEVNPNSPLTEYKEVKAYKNSNSGCGCTVS
jgi:hypothetical protein